MKNLLKEFKDLVEENADFPLDELRDYYLVPAKQLLVNNSQITEQIVEEQTALMIVIKQILKTNEHIRLIHLNALAWDIILSMPKLLLNYQDKDGNTAAHLTCYMESFSVGLLDLMKQSGANFSLINKKGETPLMLVSGSDCLDDLKFIYAYTSKVMIDAKDFINGSTALHRAIKSKKINNIFFLLESGASVFVKDNMGYTVIDYINNKNFFKKGSQHFIEELKKMLKVFAEKEIAEKEINMIKTKKN